MDYTKFSKRYQVKRLDESNRDEIMALYQGNPYYFQVVPPFPTFDSIKEDFLALPPNKELKDKYFIGYYSDHLVAIMDLIIGYPNENTVFIGLFMVNQQDQGKYIGWNMIQDLGFYLKESGYNYIRLGVVEKNEVAKCFWDKCGFEPTGIVSHEPLYDINVLEKKL